MSQFYARYVPPATTNETTLPKSPDLKRPSISKSSQPTKKRKLEDTSHGADVLAKYSSSESTRKQAVTDKVVIKKKKHSKSTEGNVKGEVETLPSGKKKSKSIENSSLNVEHDTDMPAPEDDETQLKHSAVFSRLHKSRQQAQLRSGKEKEDTMDTDEQLLEPQVHPDRAVQMDLGPIPQPQDPETVTKPPLYSTAPEWVQNPIRVDDGLKRTFKELGVRKKLRENLQAQGKNTALPVQSSVLPLLIDREVERRNDICVAAATGSGKTFAYVLPILQSLQRRPTVTLRAVVVVPTRALVKQVLQTFDMCSTGFDIQLGSVEGSKTLEEERKQLVEEIMVYDPDEYRTQKESPVDWATFSLEDTLEQVRKENLLANVGYITRFQSKVDVLVATPGRLIEHLQSTKGFNLDYVQWFIVDEADRLLNESYHDWLDVVLPALKSQKATERRDKLLQQMKMDVPKRIVTKILLSATMTNDISQLMSLELRKPQLVLMENMAPEKDHDAGDIDIRNPQAEFTLPARLRESAVALKDTDNKPLYLLELLNQQIFKDSLSSQSLALRPAVQSQTLLSNGVNHNTSSTSSSSTSSSSSSSSSDSDSQNASDTDDDSDSDKSIDTTSTSSLSSDVSTRAIELQNNSASGPLKSTSKTTLPRALIFTKSTESAHRLARLLSLLSPSLKPVIATLTRSSSQNPNNKSSRPTKAQQRTFRKTLASFVSGNTRVLISTDLSSRGLDIPNLENVVNYDVPASALTYVHRVGRTARAGQAGCAWTLVEHKQGKWFWETIAGKRKLEDGAKQNIGRSGKVGRVEVKIADDWKEKYEDALKQLGEDVAGKTIGK